MVFNEILWNLLWKTREYNNSGSPGFCEQRFQDCAVRQGGAEIPLFQRALEISWTGKKPLRHCATNLLPITAINSPQNISKIFSKQTTTIYDICCRFDFQVVLSGALTDISHLPFCQLTIFQKKNDKNWCCSHTFFELYPAKHCNWAFMINEHITHLWQLPQSIVFPLICYYWTADTIFELCLWLCHHFPIVSFTIFFLFDFTQINPLN